MTVGRYLAALLALLIAAMWNAAGDERAWTLRSAREGCEKVGRNDATYSQTLEGLTYRPSGTLWRCSGGKLYWR
jgi:hypothetical protein